MDDQEKQQQILQGIFLDFMRCPHFSIHNYKTSEMGCTAASRWAQYDTMGCTAASRWAQYDTMGCTAASRWAQYDTISILMGH